MELSERILARRYALALYQSAADKGQEAAARDELSRASRALSSEMAAFQHPRVSVEEKKGLLRRVLGKEVSPLVLRFLELLIEKKRFSLLPHAALNLSRLYDEGRGVVHATVRTASPLSEAEAKTLGERLGGFVGKTVVLDVKEDPEVLGGVVVRLGDWVFDASLSGRLRTLHGKLVGESA